jgi:rhodanese-related sulfurtransferase
MPSRNYIISAAIILLLAAGLIFLPEKSNRKELAPDELLQELQNDKRFVSVDQLVEMMIDEDPTLVLVDVRDPGSFVEFSLPGAINIPVENMLDEEYEQYFDREELQIVFYDNHHVKAEQAWMIKKRQEINNVRILKGGLNQWTEDVLLAEAPPETAPTEAFDRYSFLLGARKFFVGASGAFDPAVQGDIVETAPKRIPKIPAKVKKKVEELEGCF